MFNTHYSQNELIAGSGNMQEKTDEEKKFDEYLIDFSGKIEACSQIHGEKDNTSIPNKFEHCRRLLCIF